MSVEEAVLLLEHTGYDDFNLLEHQIKGRLEAIKVILKENQELKNKQKEFIEWVEYVINNLGSEINQINGLSENLRREKERATIKYNILIQIMKKYKEIIGDKDENI